MFPRWTKILAAIVAVLCVLTAGSTYLHNRHSNSNLPELKEISRSEADRIIQPGRFTSIVEVVTSTSEPALFLLIRKDTPVRYAFYSTDDSDLRETIRKSGAEFVIKSATQSSISDIIRRNTAQSAIGYGVSMQTANSVMHFLLNIVMIAAFSTGIFYLLRQTRQTKTHFEIISPKSNTTRLSDVAGNEHAKKVLRQAISHETDAAGLKKMGARPRCGVLLTGPAGTGKTYLARALAGESSRPFIAVSGAGFDETYVGTGAARLRKLFKEANRLGAIVFIDEIDALARARSPNAISNNTERESTLDQFLVLADGVAKDRRCLLIAATNRADILDPALTRPGRFDRTVHIGLPSLPERAELAEIELRETPHDASVSPDLVASLTAGMSGADISNLINEARLIALTANRTRIDMTMVSEARNTILLGATIESTRLSAEDLRTITLHECGHLLAVLLLPDAEPAEYATNIPREKALGCVVQRRADEKPLYTRDEILTKLTILLAGRAAEYHYRSPGQVTTGAQSDYHKATELAWDLIARNSMTDATTASYGGASHISQKTRSLIEDKVNALLERAQNKARDLIEDHADFHMRLFRELDEKRELFADDISRLQDEYLATLDQDPRSSRLYALIEERPAARIKRAPNADIDL